MEAIFCPFSECRVEGVAFGDELAFKQHCLADHRRPLRPRLTQRGMAVTEGMGMEVHVPQMAMVS